MNEHQGSKDLSMEILKLSSVEANLAKLRKDCNNREKLWTEVDKDIKELEQQVMIYRYRLEKTQDEEDPAYGS